MGALAHDTAVEGEDGRYRATLSADWEIWGPNGGYLAAVALRAAGASSRLPRPASFACHFLGVAEFAPVDLTVEILRDAKRAQSLRVSMTQEGRPMLEALVWAVDDGLHGLVHDAAPAPEVPGPAELTSVEEFVAQHPEVAATFTRHKFFDNLEERPLAFVTDWEHRPAGEPVHRCWYRFRPTPCFDDPWTDAGRLLVTVDTFQWPAAVRGHDMASLRHVAPSLDLACRFHRLDEARVAPWLFVEARSPVADGGLVGGAASVWSEDGALLASGGQQMLCRPA